MKFPLLITILLISSLQLLGQRNKLIHNYLNCESSVNDHSNFAVLNRNIEFEYEYIEEDSILLLTVMLNSGFNEGDMIDSLFILMHDDDEILLTTKNIMSREFIDEHSYSTNKPVAKSRTVIDPGGIVTEIQPDGTHKQVIKNASHRIENYTENQVTNHLQVKSQIFNKAKYKIKKDKISKLKKSKVEGFDILFKDEYLRVNPSRIKMNMLLKFLQKINL